MICPFGYYKNSNLKIQVKTYSFCKKLANKTAIKHATAF